MKRFLNGNGFKAFARVLMQHVFATKLRFCLFCLEYILFIQPPMKELERDLRKVESSEAHYLQKWAHKTYRRYFS